MKVIFFQSKWFSFFTLFFFCFLHSLEWIGVAQRMAQTSQPAILPTGAGGCRRVPMDAAS